jgi:signal peptidase II
MSYFIIMAVTVLADQLTKAWIVHSFDLYGLQEIIPGFFNLVYVTNTGAAFSMLADIQSAWKHYFFLLIGAVAAVGLTVAAYRMRKDNRLYGVALALICGGALGNVIDRVRLGSVVDFLDFHLQGYHWPAFNVADSAICIGAGLFLLINILESGKQQKRGV